MPSVITGYEYDIFISYRQNDNKYDKWVTEFVSKLKFELEATLKDRLSIYFDENPQDGILETNQVDKSLSGKLKCLIFIPIVSMTYCDTKSFAWKQEFLPFKEQASNDDYGLDIRLPNGNFTSRILPVKIHDIDLEDVRLLEKELSGALRSIDFIYRSAGVNRPLRPIDDDLMESVHSAIYRNQINKVANAIKELIYGIKHKESGAPDTPPVGTTTTTTTSMDQVTTASVSASLPDHISFKVVNSDKPTVFLAWTSFDLKSVREEMVITLQKAGFNVVPNLDCPSDEQEFMNRSREALSSAGCSLHILSNEFGRRFEENDELSFPQYQFDLAKSQSESSDFQTFVWFYNPDQKDMKPSQERFINYIRNNISKNMMFSNSLGTMQLVDDIRSVMFTESKKEIDTKDTDIFFIFNSQDEPDAQSITDILGNEYPIETMNILPDGEDQYREISTQQIPKSKLAVIYFKYAADWALPFIKQIWKRIGGASSPTPILLVGEDEPKTNIARTFKAPKVVSTIVPKNTIPEEIKKVYIKVLEL